MHYQRQVYIQKALYFLGLLILINALGSLRMKSITACTVLSSCLFLGEGESDSQTACSTP